MWYFGQLSDDHFSACTPQKMKCLCRHEPAKFCFLGALSAQLSMSAWLWDLCCFLIVIVSFSRLRSLSKEGGGHPRRSCVGVAARGGNPGQEGRNQGRRANERVSGETLFLPSLIFSRRSLPCSCCFRPMSGCLSLFYLAVLPSVFVFLCLSLPLSLSECVFWQWHGLPQLWQLPPGTECVRACDCVWLHRSQSWSFNRNSTHVFYRSTLLITIWRTFEGSRSSVQQVSLGNFWAKS